MDDQPTVVSSGRHCEKVFFPPPTDMEMSRARWCGDCQRFHPAKNRQGWLFSTGGLFATRKFYVAEYDQVRRCLPLQTPCNLIPG